ncbi:MAG: HpcH/HpaI aldolase family protein [Candidatus Zipacnadales bacterium]
MGPNPLKRKLREGKSVFGPFVNLPNPGVAEILGGAGYDFVLFDMEHGPQSLESVENCLRACELKGSVGLVRTPDGSPQTVSKVLDAGAQGILVPHVKSAEQAAEVVSAMTFGPPGTRGINAVSRAANYGQCDFLEFFRESDEERLVMIQIEDREAVEVLDEIAAVPGIDVIFCGPYDLSRSLGQIGNPEHPAVKTVVQRIVEVAAAQANCVPGLYVGSAASAAEWQARGARFFAYGSDTWFLGQAAKAAFDEIAHLR